MSRTGLPRHPRHKEQGAFGRYSEYYDLLYKDKDYRGEARHILRLLSEAGCAPKSILELGSGTGRHAMALAGRGVRVCGVERSEGMLARALARVEGGGAGTAPLFVRGDIRSVRLARRFDAALALFHVMSYQAEDKDLRAVFRTAREHVRPGGIFLFDAWYGPAVLAQRPAARLKLAGDGTLTAIRRARPAMIPGRPHVEVRYRIRAFDDARARAAEFEERHLLRYLFDDEVRALARRHGFAPLEPGEWLTGRPLGPGTWSACFLLRRLAGRSGGRA